LADARCEAPDEHRLAGGLFSVAALVLAGIAFAAGINPTGVCGGG